MDFYVLSLSLSLYTDRLQQMEHLATYRSQLADATKLTSNLTEAISSQCRNAAGRENKALLEVLTPEQAAKFHSWKATNQDRCNRVMKKKRPEPETSYPVLKESALAEFCRRLEEVLRISKKEEDYRGVVDQTRSMNESAAADESSSMTE